MTAKVWPYSADSEDTVMSYKIECLDCGIEWGWSRERPGVLDRLEMLADEHNTEFHG